MIRILTFVCLIFFLFGCEEKTNEPVPAEPNILAEIKGAYNLNYSGSGRATVSLVANKYVVQLGTSAVIDGKNYMLGIFIIFSDGIEKTGIFDFTDIDSISSKSGDFAVGTFELVKGSDKEAYFVSEIGKLEITLIQGSKVTGTFSFKAKEESTGRVVYVENGVITF